MKANYLIWLSLCRPSSGKTSHNFPRGSWFSFCGIAVILLRSMVDTRNIPIVRGTEYARRAFICKSSWPSVLIDWPERSVRPHYLLLPKHNPKGYRHVHFQAICVICTFLARPKSFIFSVMSLLAVIFDLAILTLTEQKSEIVFLVFSFPT